MKWDFCFPGLYGEKGILPAHTQLPNLKYPKQCFFDKLTLLCFSSFVGLNVSYMMELLSLAATILSFIGCVESCGVPLSSDVQILTNFFVIVSLITEEADMTLPFSMY